MFMWQLVKDHVLQAHWKFKMCCAEKQQQEHKYRKMSCEMTKTILTQAENNGGWYRFCRTILKQTEILF